MRNNNKKRICCLIILSLIAVFLSATAQVKAQIEYKSTNLWLSYETNPNLTITAHVETQRLPHEPVVGEWVDFYFSMNSPVWWWYNVASQYPPGTPIGSALTDETGHASISFVPSEWGIPENRTFWVYGYFSPQGQFTSSGMDMPVIRPTLTLNPINGPADSTVNFAISGYKPDSEIEIRFGPFWTFRFPSGTTDAIGTLTGSFTVPQVPPGIYDVMSYSLDQGVYAFASFTVTGTPSDPEILLIPTEGPVRSTVDFTVSNFQPDMDVEVTFGNEDNGDIPVATVTTDNTGFAMGSFAAPLLEAGSYTVTATDDTGHQANTGFTITAATITLNPNIGNAGSTATFLASNFPPNTNIQVKFGNVVVDDIAHVTATTDAAGIAEGLLIIPYVGPNPYLVIASDPDGTTASTSFTVIGPEPTLTLTPNQGAACTEVHFAASNFPPNIGVNILILGDIIGEGATTNADGSAYGTFTMWVLPPGTFPVIASDQYYDQATAFFTIPTPTITLNSSYALAGSGVAFTLSNFPTQVQVQVTLCHVYGDDFTFTEVITDTEGAATGTFTVPAIAPGAYYVFATDMYDPNVFDDNAQAPFTIIGPSACTTVAVNDNSATADQSGTTGVSVSVSGPSLPNGAQLTITSINYGTTQPSGTVDVSVGETKFFDVQVISASGEALGSDVEVVVSFSDSSFTASSIISYWDENNWVPASNQQFIAPHTMSGTIPASALTGTPIMISPQNPFIVPEYALGSLLSVLTCFTAFVAYKKHKKPPTSNSC